MDKEHEKRKESFAEWRKRRKLSYKTFANAVNGHFECEVVNRATLISWAQRGTRPRTMARTMIRKVFKDCPLAS